MVVWCEAWREVREGGVGGANVLGILWRFWIGSYRLCIQAGYKVRVQWRINLGQLQWEKLF